MKKRNKKKTTSQQQATQYRQGDVLFIRVDAIPASAKKVETTALVHGEATGHAHRHVGGEHFQVPAGELARQFLAAPKGAAIVHEEHDRIELPASNYEVKRQREYTPQEVRNVAD